MHKEVADKLNRELRKEQLKNMRIWVVAAFLLCAFSLYFVGYSAQDTEKVNGIVSATHTRLHDEGHTKYLMVQLSESKPPVKVRLPAGVEIKKGAKVEINEIETLWFGKTRYTFSRYLE